MDFFPLQLFPQGGLSSSVITTVWVGVAVVVFFNLRFGWVLSGLIVPGYLVPLLLVKPWAAGAILFEALLTYLIVRLYSEHLNHPGWWGSLFGRDRFFAFVLASIVVRLVCDGLLFPWVGSTLEQQFQINFAYQSNLHSFGLVVVALMANQLWKPGVRRGLMPMLLTIGLTYLIVRYGLMEFTNFSISNLGYMYEGIASNILASPKSYIILLVAAFIASRMNLHYGWDYNGILIPALLALQWYDPMKILASFAEAWVIYLIALALFKTPLFNNANIEGGRKLLLFFNIGFVYKLVLGYVVLAWFPEFKVTDSYAFGYLLATLMALKMHDKDIAARLTRTTLQTSVAGVLVGGSIGFALTFLPVFHWSKSSDVTVQSAEVKSSSDVDLMTRLNQDKVVLYQSSSGDGMQVPSIAEIDRFSEALSYLDKYRINPDEQYLIAARGLLASLNYQLERVDQHYLYLSESGPVRGWGIYLYNLKSTGSMLLEVPAPLDEKGTIETAAWLFDLLDASALAIAGSRRKINSDGSSDVLRNAQTLYHAFHRHNNRLNLLQLRGYTPETIRALSGIRQDANLLTLAEPESTLWVKSTLPEGVDLVQLKNLLGSYQLHWETTPFDNLQRTESRRGFAELFINRTDMRRLITRSMRLDEHVPININTQRIDGYLQEWLVSGKGAIAPRGSGGYQVPKLEELLFFDEEVITPLLRVMEREYVDGEWRDGGVKALAVIAQAAAVFDYQIVRYRHQQSGQDYLILREDPAAEKMRHWGSYVFRLGESDDYLIQVPRPLYEHNSFEFGVSMFERLKARVLLLAGTHPISNLDGSSDLIRLSNIRSLFTLVNQVVLRESRQEPLLVLHSRAYGVRSDLPMPDADLLLAFYSGANLQGGLHPNAEALVEVLAQDGFNYQFVDGSISTSGYEVGSVPQSLYLNASVNKDFGIIWVSPKIRASYRQQSANRQQQKQFLALGISTTEVDVASHLPLYPLLSDHSITAAFRGVVSDYLRYQNIVSLHRLQREWPQFSYQHLVDRDSRQSFLMIAYKGAVALVNLAPRRIGSVITTLKSPVDASVIQRYLEVRSTWLLLREDG
ncbi:MAG: poly-gamma-glutamate biosynthesis protein PgsC/CapC [Gammaproteobacteria bacterium]|nr:poly-gamma-glutamate biosynthesis protein PgsC/CapC [Gammaproteobacteria bacterium]MCF6229806.1 poly-gamma-glutamate biosynthesis protein PgsC/CapC [Gammaproteobacteria bacterium]